MLKAIRGNFILLNPLYPWKIAGRYRHVFGQLLKRQLSQRYRASTLGAAWSVIQPLFMLLVYTYVFREVFKVRWGNEMSDTSNSMFAITMFCGMAFFNIFSEALNLSCGVITGNINFVKKVMFPLELLPLIQLVNSAIVGMVWFLLILLGNTLNNGLGAFSWSLVAFPVVLASFLLFSGGLCFLTASLSVFFRDMQFLTGMILQVLFFITPIFYPVSAVPKHFRWILEWNPLSHFIDQARNILLFGVCPSGWMLGWLLVIGLVSFQLGFMWFMITKKGFADVL